MKMNSTINRRTGFIDLDSKATVLNLQVFAIRQISTGYFLPALARSGDRPSNYEPTANCIPRFFHTRKSATSALTQWLQGVWENGWDMDGFGSLEPNPVYTRDKSDMEVVEIFLTGQIL